MYTINTRVLPSGCNEKGELKLYAAMQMMQDCSELWMESESFLQQKYKEEGRAQLLASREIEIRRVPLYGEHLTVTTSVFDCKPLFGYRNTVIRDEAGAPCYVTWSMGAFVDRETGQLKRLTSEILESLHYDEKVEMDYHDRRIVLPMDKPFEEVGRVGVAVNDIDYNHHVNNANYVRIAMEYMPAEFLFKHVRVEWKMPARIGDVIVVRRFVDDGVIYFNLLNQDGKVCTILEFR